MQIQWLDGLTIEGKLTKDGLGTTSNNFPRMVG
jgi:hypothetical protein